MKGPDPKGRAFAGSVPMVIQPRGDAFDAERTTTAIPFKVEGEDFAHQFRFNRINRQLLLDLCAAPFCLDNAVTKGRRSAVPEALLVH